jgi:hypothetical protein
MMIPFSAGKVIFAWNGEDYITLFEGRQESWVSTGALKYLHLVARMQNPDSAQIQHNYENKIDEIVKRQECRHSCESRSPEVFK